MNIILSRECSNSCAYCFAALDRRLFKDAGDGKDSGMMSLERATTLAHWLGPQQPRKLNLIGGEPFLNPYLLDIIAVLQSACPKTELTLFTGGLLHSEHLASLRARNVGILVNVNEERDYTSSKAFRRVIAFVERAISAGLQVGVGFNIWRSDFDWEFMPALAYKLGRQGFRWTVANPNLGGNGNVVPPAGFRLLSKKCTQMLRAATRLDLIPNLDCPLPICFFDDEDLAWIARFHPNVVENLGVCDGPVDITPELEAMRCFSLSSLPRTPVADHTSVTSIRQWLRKEQYQWLLTAPGIYQECDLCPHFTSGRCQGGCLGWRNETGSPASLPHELYALLQQGQNERAIFKLESSNVWSRTTLALYLAALAAQRLGDSHRVRRFASMALTHNPDQFLKTRLLHLLETLNIEEAASPEIDA